MREDWRSELSHSWPLLGEPDREVPGSLSAYALPVALAWGHVRVCLDGYGHRHVLVPLAPTETVWPDRRESVLRFDVRPYVFDGSTDRYADVTCTRPDLNDLFDDVVVDVLTAITDSDEPASSTAGVVARWRDFFATRGRPLLSPNAQLGLFGELFVLGVASRLGRNLAAEWLGPLNAPHDFEFADLSVEVKGVGFAREEVEVHGVEQLDLAGGLPLSLVVVRIKEDEEGLALTDLVDSVRGTVADREVYESRLRSAGYSGVDADRYRSRVLSVDEVITAPVLPGFPRIIGSSFTVGDVPPGVGGLSYLLDVGEIVKHGVQGMAELEKALGDAP